MLSADAIVKLQDATTAAWHALPEAGNDFSSADPWLARVARQHRANFDLWHIEDEARAPGATDAQLADVKRRIDRTNQLRNDLVEDLDRTLLDWLAPQRLPAEEAPLHSETPGLIIDRLSILALKIYHTREESERCDATPERSPNGAMLPPNTANETAIASLSFPINAATSLAASTRSGLRYSQAPGVSSSIASSRCTTTPLSTPQSTVVPNRSLVADAPGPAPIDGKQGYGYKEGLSSTIVKLDDPAGVIRFNFALKNGSPPLNR